ncbi:MAG: hypothetical protein F6K08_16695 [Okeania sp. SIO1H6]|nr:hypothetical protein [Okeania sp. SIO1H4]NES91017.1 hypothetical protein [Okeania sp. SIO2B9]NET14346.1 hypothetical protein [Okeania sp. SIO1H6]NET22643.1 hypothetical protein [Okeania sp. SIO1H5]NET79187.1 hypothetical protein [Okeania sp. SIO1F9]NET95842.1 hypothetical protein [Okeania sp. SIO1H2]
MRDMAERLLEANQRGLWQSANQKILDKLQAIFYDFFLLKQTNFTPYQYENCYIQIQPNL